MRTDPYRRVLRVQGMRPLYGLTLLARIPVTAAPTALTLRVVLGLHQGFARSGLAAAAVALGMAFGAPLLGRLTGRRGARTVLAVTTVSQLVFWCAAARLPYAWLVPAAFAAGALFLPVFSLTRQAIATLLAPEDRQAGLSLDSMSVEVSYPIGPALGVVAVTRLGSATAMVVLGVSLGIAGVGLYLANPPTAPEGSGRHGGSTVDLPAGHRWLTPVAVGALVATGGATFTLAGTDIALTASMRAFGHVGLLGAVIAAWCLASLAGGFVYGMMTRRRDPLLLLVLLAGLTVLLALAGSWWALLLLAVPSGLFCAPLLSSTVETITRVAPSDRRGRALGIHTSALTLGNAAGAPLAGAAVDRWSPAAGFVTVGSLGCLLAVAAIGVPRLQRDRHGTTRRPPLVAPATSPPTSPRAYRGASGRRGLSPRRGVIEGYRDPG